MIKKSRLILFLILTVFVGFCLYLQYSQKMSILLTRLQIDYVPSELLSYNKLGEMFRHLKLVKIIPNNSDRFQQNSESSAGENIGPFQKRRQISDALLTLGEQHPMMEKVRNTLQGKKIQDNIVRISVITEDENLRGTKGIISNHNKHGKQWERLAYLAIFKGEELIEHSTAGIRLHGGKSRDPSLERHNFRLYFRKIYGKREISSDYFFPSTDLLRTLVVHYDGFADWPLNSVIASDVYKMAGVPTIEYFPVIFYLNEVDQGLYWVSPHLSKKYILKQYDLHKIFYQRYKGKQTASVYRNEVGILAYDYKVKLSERSVRKIVDLDELVNYFIAVTYSGNSDWNQGVAYRDAEKNSSIWRWIGWDVDLSFIDLYRKKSKKPERFVWQQEGLALLMKGKVKRIRFKRQLLLRRLFQEDPYFKDVFKTRYVHVLNHELGQKKLYTLFAKYEEILQSHNSEINPLLLDFFNNRHDFIRNELSQYFNFSSYWDVRVEGVNKQKIIVDGYPETTPYIGKYPEGMEITVGLPQNKRGGGHWLVNDRVVNSQDLKIAANQHMTIKYIEN